MIIIAQILTENQMFLLNLIDFDISDYQIHLELQKYFSLNPSRTKHDLQTIGLAYFYLRFATIHNTITCLS